MKRLFFSIAALASLSQQAFAAGAHCAFSNDEDWGSLRFGSADAAIQIVDEWCKPGDHLSISYMRTHEASYLIAVICDPAFSINVTPLDNQLSSLNCVFAGDKLDRFE